MKDNQSRSQIGSGNVGKQEEGQGVVVGTLLHQNNLDTGQQAAQVVVVVVLLKGNLVVQGRVVHTAYPDNSIITQINTYIVYYKYFFFEGIISIIYTVSVLYIAT